MAHVMPFKAIRPVKEEAATIAALPYDVYSREEAYAAVKDNPNTFLTIDRPETMFAPDYDMYSAEVYRAAADKLKEWISGGRFIQDDKQCYYLYELTMNHHVQTGIVACVAVSDYVNEIVKRHENTREEKERDRIEHIRTCNAQTGPIFLAYKNDKSLAHLVSQTKEMNPIYDFTSEDGIRHRCWIIDDTESVKLVGEGFAKIENLYIADGHHRAASAVKVALKEKKTDSFMAVLFPDDELQILDYNRVVKDLNGYDAASFLERIKDVVDIVESGIKPYRPKKKGQVSMFLDDIWYLCEFKTQCYKGNVVDRLDVSLLQNFVLEPILEIKDPRTDTRIDFVGGIRGYEDLTSRCHKDCKVAFAMYPVSMQELMNIADNGLLMPPKSTWFEPKLRSGLFIHTLDK